MKSHRTHSARRALAAIAAVAVTGGLVGAIPDARAAEGFSATRVAGANRYATAAQVATSSYTGATAAILATGEGFADALAGSYLSSQLGTGAPILLTTKDDLPAQSLAALDSMEIDTVYILGGPAAVGEGVVEDLGDRDVHRIAGNDRYETSAEVATEDIEGAPGPGSTTVIIASGEGFADALAGGAVAFESKMPVLLTPANDLPASVSAAITSLEATRAIVLGGTAAVSEAVVNELKGLGLTTSRIAGANRYETATAIADLAVTQLGFGTSGVNLASGENFPDALAAGPASGVVGRPLLLTAGDELSEPTEDWLVEHSDTLTGARVFGGAAAVSETVLTQVTAAAGSGDRVGAARIVKTDEANDVYWVAFDGGDSMFAVKYESGDDFTIDGAPATMAAFEDKLNVRDIIEGDDIKESNAEVDDADDPDNAIDADDHGLRNVAETSFTSGMVGNVNTAADQFDFISPVSGQIFRRNVTYTDHTASVDGGQATAANLEADLSEGDTLVIETNGTFALTNRSAQGLATDVEITDPENGDAGSPRAIFKIDHALGDDPSAGENTLNPNGENPETDSHFIANGSPAASGQAFFVNGQASSYSVFMGHLTAGDTVTYARRAGTQTFTVVDQEPLPIEGRVGSADDIDNDGDDIPDNPDPDQPNLGDDDLDGGSFTIVDDDGVTHTVSYDHDATFIVDGEQVDEAEFEDDLSSGDEVAYTPSDTPSGTEERVELF